MDRTVQGVSQSSIRPQASPIDPYGVRQTRVFTDPNYDILGKGIQAATKGFMDMAAADAQIKARKKEDDLIKASAKVRSFKPVYERFVVDNPQLNKSDLNLLWASNENFSAEVNKHLEEITDPAIKQKAVEDIFSAYNEIPRMVVAQEGRNERIRVAHAAAETALTGLDPSSMKPEELTTNLDQVVSFLKSDRFNLSTEDVGQILLDLQGNMLTESPEANAFIAESMKDNPELSPEIRLAFKEQYDQSLQMTKIEEQRVKQFTYKEIDAAIKAGANLDEIYNGDNEKGRRWAENYSWEQIQAMKKALEPEKQQADIVGDALLQFGSGRFNMWVATQGEKGFSALQEKRMIEKVKELYSKTPEFQKAVRSGADPEAIKENYVLEQYRLENRVPLYAKEFLNSTLNWPDKPFQSLNEIPRPIRDALQLAQKLSAKGMLTNAIGEEEKGLEWESLVHQINAGYSELEAYNNLIQVRQNPDKFKIGPIELKELGRYVGNEVDANKDILLPRARSLYSIYRSKGLEPNKAREATVERLKGATYVVDDIPFKSSDFNTAGNYVSQEGLEERIGYIKKNYAKTTNGRLSEDDIQVRPIADGYFAVTNKSGDILVTPDGKTFTFDSSQLAGSDLGAAVQEEKDAEFNKKVKDAQRDNTKNRNPSRSNAQR